MSSTERVFSWVIKGGLLLTPFLVFVVTRSLYFPFITGKNFAFRILIELVGAIWVIGAIKFPSLRPKLSPLVWAVACFTAIMGLATVFALSPYHSFWSNFERMEGYVALLHFALYFLILSSVFKTKRDWDIFLYTTLAASVIISFYAVFQLTGALTIHQGGTRIDATFGNATYLAAYLLFHLFFLAWFFLRTQNWPLRLVFAAIFVFELVILYHTATRGAILGLLGGLFVLAVILSFSAKGTARRFALSGLGIVVLLPVVFFLVKDTSFVKNSLVLERFAGISLSETTTRSRFTIWKMAFDGWRERPIIGWGQESFVYIFSKYYEPSLWPQEPWFDRAHNIFLDWLTAGGILGLLSYLAIYGAALWVLVDLFRKNRDDRSAFAVLIALLAAHFFQNIFVFDNLTSYILFFAVLAYIHYLHESSRTAVSDFDSTGVAAYKPIKFSGGVEAIAAVLVAAVFVVTVYYVNIRPIASAKSVLDTLRIMNEHEPSGKIDALIASFKGGIEQGTYGVTELREQISQMAVFVLRDQSVAQQDKSKYLDFAIGELEKQRKEFPSDVRAKAFLATLYSSAGQTENAIAVVNEALAISPRRPQFYFIAGEAYVNSGESGAAIDALKRAYDLAPDYPEAVNNLAVVLILSGNDAEAEKFLSEHYGTSEPANERFAQAYLQRGRIDRALIIWKKIVAGTPDNAQNHANLGAMYARAGDRENAVKEISEAIRLEPRFKSQGEELIRQINAGAPVR